MKYYSSNELKKLGFLDNPLTDGTLDAYRVINIPITSLTLSATESSGLSRAKSRKCKNMFALGVVFWLFERPYSQTFDWIGTKYKENENVAHANQAAFKAGYDFAITTELLSEHYYIEPAQFPNGRYKQLTGNTAFSLGCVAASYLANRPLFIGGYPITPASDILHLLANMDVPGITAFQAEDEMGAIGDAIGAAYGGALAITSTSGPGMDLKAEAMGLAVMAELPLVIIDVQRAGPSTGMPTKVEQSDLTMAIYGRHGECPIPVLAPNSPNDCFDIVIEAFEMAIKYMTPVIVLSDAYLANSAEPWQIPDVAKLKKIKSINFDLEHSQAPYQRDSETLSRPWITPGEKNLMHCLGGLEKQSISGHISYDPINHQKMVDLRHNKIANTAKLAQFEYIKNEDAETLLISWGSTRGVVYTVLNMLKAEGVKASMIHLRHLFPLPIKLKSIFNHYKNVMVIELNKGQLRSLIRSEFLVDAHSINKISGQPFFVDELKNMITQKINDLSDPNLEISELSSLQTKSATSTIE